MLFVILICSDLHVDHSVFFTKISFLISIVRSNAFENAFIYTLCKFCYQIKCFLSFQFVLICMSIIVFFLQIKFSHFYRKIQCVWKRLHIYSMYIFLTNQMLFVISICSDLHCMSIIVCFYKFSLIYFFKSSRS